MSEFLTPDEIHLIKSDYANLIASPEACEVTIEYYSELSASELNPTPTQVTARAIQHHIKPRDLKGLKSSIIEIGDCVFYFTSTQNLQEPQSGVPVAANTLKIVDAEGERWTPVTLDEGDAKRFMTFQIASMQIGQMVICKLEK